MPPRATLAAFLAAAASFAASCRPSPPEPPPAPSATAPSAPPPEPVAPVQDAAAAPDVEPTARPERPPDPLTLAFRAWEERMRSPLISEDARLVAIDPRLHDDGDGDPPYLQIIDVDADRTQQHFDVPPGAPPEVGLARLAEAAAALDAHRWSTLLTYETSNDDSVPMRQHGLGYARAVEGTGEGLLVRFHEPTLTVREVGGRTLFRRAFPGWSEREPGCTFFTDLLGVWASRKLGVLVVTLGHSSSPHHCSASPETHTVRFAPRARY